jgi:hypothetical protein
MKYIITLVVIVLFFSGQMLSQEKIRNEQNPFKMLYEKLNSSHNFNSIDAKDSESFSNDFDNSKFMQRLKDLGDKFSNESGTNNKNSKTTSIKKILGDGFLQVESIYQSWDGANWVNGSKSTNVYDTRNNRVQLTYQNWNVSVWENSSRYSYIFDSNDNQTEYIYQNWSGTTWVNLYRYLSTYNANNRRTVQISQSWNGTAWVNDSQYLYTYNANNDQTERLYQTWSGTTWTNYSRYSYTYDSNHNSLVQVYESWSGTAWVNQYKYTNSYDANNNPTQQISQDWDGSTWVNSSKVDITYNANKDPLVYIFQSWDVSTWKNNSRYSFTYNANNDMTEYIYQTWDVTVWKNSQKYSYVYNSNHDPIEYLSQTWNVSIWENNYKSTQTYDSNNNNIGELSQSWDGVTWVNSYKYTYTYAAATTITLITSYSFGDATKTASYQMIGLPGDINLPIANIVTGSPGATGDWRAFWDAGTGAYTEYSSSATFNFTPGKAFWVISKNQINVNIPNVNPVTRSGNAYSFQIHNGWNLISNPFDKVISWSNVQTTNSVTDPIHFYQNGSYTNPTNFEPYKGYYFFNRGTLTNLNIPYASLTALPKQNSVGLNELEITLTADAMQKGLISAGISEDAKNGIDQLDVFSPPSQFCEISMSLYNNTMETDYKYLQKDFRPEIGEGQEFNFSVKNISDQTLDMVVNGMEKFTGYEIFLLDKSLFKLYDLTKQSSFEIRATTTEKQYSLLIGTEAFILQKKSNLIPTEFALFQNYPNPFNPTTRIMFSLPQQSNISLKIYNLLGELAVELINNQVYEAGYHEVTFNGSQLASGIYLFKLQTNSEGRQPFVEVKKMMLIK